MRIEVLIHGSIVTEVDDLVVIRGPPPSNLRIPLRLVARVIAIHMNATFNSTLTLPIDVMADDLLLPPRALFVPPAIPPPAPPPVPPAPAPTPQSPTSAYANRHPINLGAIPSITPTKLW